MTFYQIPKKNKSTMRQEQQEITSIKNLFKLHMNTSDLYTRRFKKLTLRTSRKSIDMGIWKERT